MTDSLQIKRNKYFVVLNMKDENGNRKLKWINTNISADGNNKREANKVLREMITEYEGKNTTQSKDILFIDFMYHWLETMSGAIEQNTHESYNSTITRYIKPYFIKNQIKLQSP